jgi:endoglucanase
MADMIEDVGIPRDWVNAYTVSGFTAGSALTIQNKGAYPILVMVRVASPAAGNLSGFRLTQNETWQGKAGDTVWLRGEGGTSMVCLQSSTANVIVPESVSVSPKPISLTAGSTQQLLANVLPSGSPQAVSWSTSDASVATVSTAGLVTAVPGAATGATASITATTSNGKTDTTVLTIAATVVVPASVSIDPTSASLTAGTTQQFTATVLPANSTNKTVTWATSDTSKATVNASGLVTTVIGAVGAVDLTATTVSGGRTSKVTVTVTVAEVAMMATTYNPIATVFTSITTETRTSMRMPVTIAGARKNYGHMFPWWAVKENLTPVTSTGSQNVGNGVTFEKVAVEYNGVSMPAYFPGNSRSAVVTDGQATDPAAWVNAADFGLTEFPHGATLVVKFDMTVPANGIIPITDKYLPGFTGTVAQCWTYDPAATVVSDIDAVGVRTLTSGTAATTRGKWFNGIGIGVPVDPTVLAVCAFGDSLGAGLNDDVFPQPFGPGYIGRYLQAFTKPVAYLNLCAVGRYVVQMIPDARMTRLVKLCNQGIGNGGANDLLFGRTGVVSTMITAMNATVAAYKAAGLKTVTVHKMPPVTNDTTGNWQIQSNLTYATNFEPGGIADVFNAAIDNQGFDLVLNGDEWRDLTDRNKNRTNGTAKAYWKDGIHPQKILNDIMVAVEKPALVALWANGTTTGRSMEADFVAKTYKQGLPLASSTLSAIGGAVTRASTATYWDAGLLKTAAANVARIQTDGLIIERSRTNLQIQSNNPGAWGNGAATGTANGATGLDGTSSAFLATSGSSTKSQHNTTIPTTNLPYTAQIWVKTLASGKVYLPAFGIYDKVINANDDTSYYDFATNTFGAGMMTGWKADVGGIYGIWTRLSITMVNSQAGSIFTAIWKQDATAQITWGGMMLEQSASPTSYVPTTTVAVTRAAETLLIKNGEGWYLGQGTMAADVDDLVLATQNTNGIAVEGIGRVRKLSFDVGTKFVAKRLNVIGMNLAGAEFGSNVPGVADTDYFWPAQAVFARYKAYGINLVRVPFKWERIQKTLGGALDTAELARMVATLNLAAANGMQVVLDMHNYFERLVGSTTFRIGSADVTRAQWVDCWTKIVTAVQGNAGLYGYGLMNEPKGTTGYDASQQWAPAAQACVTAIRAIDPTTTIFVAGDGYSGAHVWLEQNKTFPLVGKNLVYEAHSYLDSDNSGRYVDRSEAIDPQVGVNRLTVFANWLKQYGQRGIIGEMGCPADMPTALAALNNAVAFSSANNIPLFYWAGGAYWSQGQETAIEYNGTVLGQMNVLDDYFKFVNQIGPQAV